MATGEGLARSMFPVGNFLWVLLEELVTAFWMGSCGPVFEIHTTYYSISWLMEEFINLMISQFVYWSLCELRIGYFSTTSTFQSSQLQVPTFHFEQIESSGASKLQSSRVRLRMDIYARSYGCCTCGRIVVLCCFHTHNMNFNWTKFGSQLGKWFREGNILNK